MAGYVGRRGAPNVSQYLRELTTVQPATPAPPATGPDEGFGSLDEDLVMFTNTQFFDFETGQNTEYQSHAAKPDSEPVRTEDTTSAAASTTAMDDFSTLDFMSGEFNFPDFGAAYTSPTLQSFPEGINGLQPIQPGAQSIYPVPPLQQHRPQQQNGHAPAPRPRVAEKTSSPESSVSPNRPMSFEDASRLAAEEDKRRRNTAASARFRIKKKQREQALEKSAKEMNDKVLALEGRISQLETENKWLKDLLMEKNDGNKDIAKLWTEFKNRQHAGANGKDGDDAAKKPRPTSPEEHEASDMTG